ncbi:hypothetical protein HOLleu_21772 [Holothuria leucospilota]|uniref:Core-binding (CB) domain-containing protein n=1 Tax=Holothuria leucospilota TaxID=206669 RepID=A0A9Q1H719_HOLLE|nr:hypothetical protein HOLleu_21772 [Holothuria leucospilota]
MGDGCSGYPLGQPVCQSLPSVVPHTTGTSETQRLQHTSPSSGTILAESTLVADPSRDAPRPPVQVSNQGQSPQPKGGKIWHQRPQHLHLAAWKLSSDISLILGGFHKKRPSTMSTYDSRLARFRAWCSERNINPMEAPLEAVDFLLQMFIEGKQVSTIRNFWPAISSIHKGFPESSTIGSNNAIGDLLRGMFKKDNLANV